MRTVIYDPQDFEPITVVEIDDRLLGQIERGEHPPRWTFAIPSWAPGPVPWDEHEIAHTIQQTTVYFERLRYGDRSHWLVFAMDPPVALLLRSIFLAGQQNALQDVRDNAFAAGFLRGLREGYR